jgi:hypothetical protein
LSPVHRHSTDRGPVLVAYSRAERHRLLIAYLVLVVAVGYALWLGNEAREEIKAQSNSMAYSNCQAIEALRQDIVAYIEASPPPPPFPEDMPEPTKQWLTEVLTSGADQRETSPGMFLAHSCPPNPDIIVRD